MAIEELTIATEDGDCPAQVFTPDRGDQPWPAENVGYPVALAVVAGTAVAVLVVGVLVGPERKGAVLR